jgi:hypothetical protein
MVRSRIGTKHRNDDLLRDAAAWLSREATVESAVLFGSSVRQKGKSKAWTDLDLHLVVTSPEVVEKTDWQRAFPHFRVCLQVVRPATGGVSKITVIFDGGQLDFVVVPRSMVLLVDRALRGDEYRTNSSIYTALSEMATCLTTGFEFIKGQETWGAFYQEVATRIAGVRLDEQQVMRLADFFLADLLWVLQKCQQGELIAAQHVLHRALSETNLRFLRELRVRRSQALPSFGLGRRLEELLGSRDLRLVKVDARLRGGTIKAAAWAAFGTLKVLTKKLAPRWNVPRPMAKLLKEQYRGRVAFPPTPAR